MPQSSRTFRIFVSSTFSDLVEERNALQENVFPKLKKMCEEHGCRFQAIDLRWGVSEEAGLDNRTMQICFEEIQRCQNTTPRPNFVILLGDRYGWCPLPEEIPEDRFEAIVNHVTDTDKLALLHRWYRRDDNNVPPVYVLQPRTDEFRDFKTWSNEVEKPLNKLFRRITGEMNLPKSQRMKYCTSATEQEISRGALDIPDAQDHVFCYFRHISNLDKLREEMPRNPGASLYVDIDDDGCHDTKLYDRINGLKKRLGTHLPKNIRQYPSEWIGDTKNEQGKQIALDHLSQFCAEAEADLTRIILKQIEQFTSITPLEQEIAAHKEFGDERAHHFIGRQDSLTAINDYIAGSHSYPLLVHGESGSGKSALMAKAAEQTASDFPGALIISRFIGATPASAEIRTLLEGICTQIRDGYGEAERQVPVPLDYQELIKEFPSFLSLATEDKPLVLFIDALDQLGSENNPANLLWLPRDLPGYVSIIFSVLDREGAQGAYLETARKIIPKEYIIQVNPLRKDEGERILDLWLGAAHRTLQTDQRSDILTKFEQNGLPLYLKLAFQEAKLWRSYGGLPCGADTVPGLSGDIPGIIQDLFARLEHPANHGYELVRKSLGYLVAARNGLTEDEMLDVLSQDGELMRDFFGRSPRSPKVDRLPVVVWSRLFFDLESYLTSRPADNTIVFGFYHRQLAEEAAHQYCGEDSKQQLHQHLADFFYDLSGPEKQKEWDTAPIRALSELPYQIIHIHDYKTAETLLCDFIFIEASILNGLFDQLLGDLDFIKSKGITNIKTIHNSMLLSSAAIRHRPHLTLQTLINRIRNEPIGSTLETQLKHAEFCLDKRGIWLCSMTSFGSERLINNIIGFLPHQNIIYVLTDQNMIESYDMGSYRLIARYGPFFKHDPIYIVIHPVSGRIIWMDSHGNIYDGFNPTKFRVRTRYFCFSFFGSGIIGVDTENNLVFYNFETESTKILAESISSISIKIFTNLDCTSAIIISGDRTSSQKILIIQMQGTNITLTKWPTFDSPITSACINDEGSTVLFATRGGHLKICNISKRTVLQEKSFRVVQGKPVRGVVQQCKMTSYLNKIFIAFATNESELLIWDCKSDKIEKCGYYSSIKEPRNLRLFETLPGMGKFVIATDVQINILDSEDSGECNIATPITNCSLSRDGWLILANNALKSVSWFINGQQRFNYFFQNFEPTSVAACSYNGTAFIGYNTGSVIRIQPDKELEEEDTVDLFDQPVVSVVNLDDERVLATSAKGELRMVRFQPVQVLRSIGPFGLAREEQYLLRLGPGDDFLCCGLNKIGSIQYTVYIVRHNDSREIVLETRDFIRGIAASGDGRAIFIAFKEKVCRFSKIHSRWIQDTCRSTDVLHIIACNNNLLGVIVREKSISYLELWSMLGDNMETVIAMELPYQCTSICSNGNVIAIGAVDGRHCIVNIKNGERDEVLST